MEKVLVVGCKKAMDDICIGCSRCLVSFYRREGVFEIYEDSDAHLMGLLNCGDCPGATIVTRLTQFKLWNSAMDELPTVIHIAPCITDQCPYAETIIRKIRNVSGIRVIEGTHPYIPQHIFAQPMRIEEGFGVRAAAS
jgi:predicted metal-binding protein